MKAAKGAVLAILRKAYQKRSRVALVAFGGEHATVVLPPTNSICRAQCCLERLPIGVATPFADGLIQSWRLIQQECIKRPGMRPILIIISDGEANVPLTSGTPLFQELFRIAEKIRSDSIVTVLIDMVAEPRKNADMRHLAVHLAASYVPVQDLKARHILKAVSEAEVTNHE